MKNVITFYLGTLLPAFGIDVEHLPENMAETIQPVLEDTQKLRELCGTGHGISRKLTWIKVFVKSIAESSFEIPDKLTHRIKREQAANDRELSKDDDGSDKHRIATEDLETMYDAAKLDIMDEMIFLTMLTTGMRIGGFVKIKAKGVASLSDGKWKVNEKGVTIEKGNKPFGFGIAERLQKLFSTWLNRHRAAGDSMYLFPGRDGGHVSTTFVRKRFHKICAKSGLSGGQFHPHALRHCYAHILLEVGNPVSRVSKLINHASIKTTEKFYLRHSSEEVTNSANIPWMKKSSKRDRKAIVPNFLDNVTGEDHCRSERKKFKHKKTKELLKEISARLNGV